MELELRHLRALCVIAETGSLTRAAIALRLSQPTLTARLRRIEDTIGAPLFIRGPRGVLLTRVGEFMLPRARAILAGVADLRSRPVENTITLGGAVASVSVGLADRMDAHLTDLDVRLTMEYSPRLLWDLITAGRLDAIATVDYPDYPLESTSDITCTPIADEPVSVALPAADPLASSTQIDLSTLADRTWAMTPADGAGWPDCFHTACARAGFTPRVRYTTPNTDSIRDLVAAGRAITACQAVHRGGDGVIVRPLTGNPVRMRHVLACRQSGPLATHGDAVIALARAAYREYVGRHRPDLLI
ncbi:LysR family transcriptional regulator [Actinokineospora enzanensis]|uniref:LysR family transcriptional regulator n=1 Tax=Actinokineospora enzanensis TaxID=155975 RepID=UPI000367A44E|nr:LysR family transcriptional regulator [Actinokineospora enzanensis]